MKYRQGMAVFDVNVAREVSISLARRQELPFGQFSAREQPASSVELPFISAVYGPVILFMARSFLAITVFVAGACQPD